MSSSAGCVGLDTLDAVKSGKGGHRRSVHRGEGRSRSQYLLPATCRNRRPWSLAAPCHLRNVPAVKNFVNGVGGHIAEGWNAADTQSNRVPKRPEKPSPMPARP